MPFEVRDYDPVELMVPALDSDDMADVTPCDLLLADLVAMFNCCLVCSCMILA